MVVMLDNGKSLRDYMTHKLGDRYEAASLSIFCDGLEEFIIETQRVERELCAQIADGFAKQGDWDKDTAECIAASIRARLET